MFPMLLLVAARRRGERVPGQGLGPLGHPIVAAAVAFVFLFAVAVFGLWIWDDPVERALALGVSAATLVVAAVSIRRGAFRPRTVVEYRVEAGPPALGFVSVVSAGREVPAVVRIAEAGTERLLGRSPALIHTPARVEHVGVELPNATAPELLLWVHAVTADGASTPPATPVDVAIGGAAPTTINGTVDRLHLPAGDQPTMLTLSMSPAPRS